MNRTYRVITSKQAARGIQKISKHIREQGSPQNADHVKESIIDKIASLNQLPNRFSIYTPLHSSFRNFRSVVLWNYVIVYEVIEDKGWVIVDRVFNGVTQKDQP